MPATVPRASDVICRPIDQCVLVAADGISWSFPIGPASARLSCRAHLGHVWYLASGIWRSQLFQKGTLERWDHGKHGKGRLDAMPLVLNTNPESLESTVVFFRVTRHTRRHARAHIRAWEETWPCTTFAVGVRACWLPPSYPCGHVSLFPPSFWTDNDGVCNYTATRSGKAGIGGLHMREVTKNHRSGVDAAVARAATR